MEAKSKVRIVVPDDPWEKIAKRMEPDKSPSLFGKILSVPRTPQLKKLMKFCIPTEEDADICLVLDIGNKGDRPGKTPARVAQELGRKDVARVRESLEQMAYKGVLYKEDKPGGIEEYSLGHFWEFGEGLSIIDEGTSVGRTMNELVNKYMDSGGREEWAPSDYPSFRTLMVDKPIDGESNVLTWELASNIIKANDRIAICKCGCRIRERKCEHRTDNCFLFGGFADETVHHSTMVGANARPVVHVTQERALQVLKESFDEGLVATTLNHSKPEEALFICMCCKCCCHILGVYHASNTGYGTPRALAKSNFRPETDREKCNLCEKCVKDCTVNALWHHFPHKEDRSDNFIFCEDTRCIGCGICAHLCPQGAITMKKTVNEMPEPDALTCVNRVEAERRH